MIRSTVVPALILTALFTVFTGVAFPIVITGIAQVLLPTQANGSLVQKGEAIRGSLLLGQNFSSPKYLHPRPSAAGAGYDPLASGGTNLGPTSRKLIAGVADDPTTVNVDESYLGVAGLVKAYREENRLGSDRLIPVDAVTRSASGLDPHISPQNAYLQAPRIAGERGLPVAIVTDLIERSIESRFIGIFGEPRVNVLKVNMALDERAATEQ